MENKVVLITGGTSGIGKATAIKFAQEGYDVIVNYNSFKDIEKYILEMKDIGIYERILLIKTNITSYNDCVKMIKNIIEKYSKIDVIINNAGIAIDKVVMQMEEREFDEVVNVNLKGTFNIVKAGIPYMIRKKSGRIVNISSIVGTNGNIGQVNYSASKAGIIGLTKSLAKELANKNILVNAVAPGFIKTNMTKEMTSDQIQGILNEIPLKRMGNAEEVARLIYFLGSDDNTYITGEIIKIDGGTTI